MNEDELYLKQCRKCGVFVLPHETTISGEVDENGYPWTISVCNNCAEQEALCYEDNINLIKRNAA